MRYHLGWYCASDYCSQKVLYFWAQSNSTCAREDRTSSHDHRTGWLQTKSPLFSWRKTGYCAEIFSKFSFSKYHKLSSSLAQPVMMISLTNCSHISHIRHKNFYQEKESQTFCDLAANLISLFRWESLQYSAEWLYRLLHCFWIENITSLFPARFFAVSIHYTVFRGWHALGHKNYKNYDQSLDI